jgi:uncharacterized protein (DUF488 family)
MPIKLFTIGFTKKTAARFFDLLRQASVKCVVDTRLNRASQLAGFSKEQDLPFFLSEICHADYIKEPLLAPTGDILSAYKKKQISWPTYEERFKALILQRKIEEHMTPAKLDYACLLCSEDKPHQCHRRLVAEYLKEKWGNVEIHHL